MAKSKVSADEKLQNQDFDLFKSIEMVDRKDYSWFDSLTEEQQRKFVPYMMIHWISAVKSKTEISSYYLMSVDSTANKYFFNEMIQKHPKLQWLMLCASSPGIGKQFHQWIPHLSPKISNLKESADKKTVNEYFTKIYPTVDKNELSEISDDFCKHQKHKYRLAKIFPNMKLDDLELLSQVVSSEMIDQYEKESGN